jgi:hypothetical protein
MLLKRIYKNFADQNWPAVILELIVVAAGIFLGLQASNWNDDRIERELERGYLIRLYEDFLASADGLERDNKLLEQQLADQAILLTALDSCYFAADDTLAIQRGIGMLGFVNPPRLFRRTVDELAASGRFDIIQNEAIRNELASIVAEVEWRNNVMESVFRNLDHHRMIIDEQVRYDVSKPIDGAEFLVAVKFDIDDLCSQSRNAAAVSAVSYQTRDRLIAFRQLVNRYRTFLPMIDEELQSRWGYVADSD